jgi:osmotically-inducible protein OsmY
MAGRAAVPRLTLAENSLLQALAQNPVTAPFVYATSVRGGKVVLTGRVGTKQVHDAAIRTATVLGITIDDQLVIDTAAAYAAAAAPPAAPAAPPAAGVASGLGMRLPAAGVPWANLAAAPPYVYPPPLFGYYDEPFYGFEPPLFSFPPWWGGLSARRLDPGVSGVPTAPAPPSPAPTQATPASASTGSAGTVEMTIDATGNATLRGTVPTLADRIQVGQEIARQPGVAGVLNLIEVRPDAAPATSRDTPPPPPTPVEPPRAQRIDPAVPGRPLAAGAGAPAAGPNGGADLGARLGRALERRPALAGMDVHVSARDGVAVLTGHVPGAYEAMLAFRVAQQTPGVQRVEDRLEFPVPQVGAPNPLVDKGRPEDVEPYLEHQMRRQFGDQVHIDRVRVRADALDVRGTIPSVQDRARVEATLRSMPILRGFHLNSEFSPES